MDKFKFATLIAFIQCCIDNNATLERYEINKINDLIASELSINPIDVGNNINELFAFMLSNQKISAIKCYRSLTGMNLKESKDAVESIMSRMPQRPSTSLGSLGN